MAVKLGTHLEPSGRHRLINPEQKGEREIGMGRESERDRVRQRHRQTDPPGPELALQNP